jgi:4-diphosphocytidyl-2-C-methyl-D-erythritol kinase
VSLKHTARSVVALAAAKVNLGLRVGAVRTDGYHEVEGLMHTIDLVDRLEVRIHDDAPDGGKAETIDDVPVSLAVEGDEADPSLLEDNLVWVAARAVAENAPARPTAIVLHKAIPMAAGLGGGSADAAAVLVALNQLWSARLRPDALVRLAADIGSDVPGVLVGGLVHVSGRGEHVRSLGAASDGRFVLGFSDVRISASDAYAALDALGAERDVVSLTANDLEPAALALHPPLVEGLEAMRSAGATAFVSGSGPTVVGVVGSDALARDVASRCEGVFRRVVVAGPSPWGVRLRFGDAS